MRCIVDIWRDRDARWVERVERAGRPEETETDNEKRRQREGKQFDFFPL